MDGGQKRRLTLTMKAASCFVPPSPSDAEHAQVAAAAAESVVARLTRLVQPSSLDRSTATATVEVVVALVVEIHDSTTIVKRR